MARFKRKSSRKTPAISTASLPDIVFMLLFFFMTVTAMKELELMVRIENPQATEVKKLENKSQLEYIYVGPPLKRYEKKYGSEPFIQLNDAFAKVRDVGPWINSRRELKDAAIRNKMTTALKIDKKTKMGIVTDIKQELRKVKALKITYLADKTNVETNQ